MDRMIRRTRLRLLAWLRRSRQRRGPVSFARRYSYKDIKKATDGFRNIVYSNSDGPSYRARFEDGATALVKEVTASCKEETSVFHREVQLLGRLHHRHLLTLRGFCTGRKRFLVFGNIENGSLKDHLNDPLKTPLNWRTRLQIAIGVVAALEYLLIFNDPSLYSISVSSSNVMLDENFTAKLSDIGINSRGNYATVPHPSVSAEDGRDQKCSSIIHQLGLLILELVTGQSSNQGGSDLIQWIRESRFGSSTHKKMIDPDLGNNYDTKELKTLLAVAKLCINAGDKPTFSLPQIYWYLQKVNKYST